MAERVHPPLVAVIGVILGAVMSAALNLMVLSNLHDETAGFSAALPVMSLVSLPVVLGTIGLVRPPALIAAGILSIPAAFTSFAGVTLPLLIPGILYLVGFDLSTQKRARISPLFVALVAIVLGGTALLGFAAPFGNKTVCYRITRNANGRTVRTTYEPATATDQSFSFSGSGARGADSGVLGKREVESGCQTGVPTTLGIALQLALVAVGIGAIVWMSRPPRSGPAHPSPAT